jgi:outer membrane cobalamin receptor
MGAATTVAAAVAGILYGSGGSAYAQEAAPAAASAVAPESLQEVVVTASAQGVKKLDASFNIVTVDQDLIKQANPKSTADLLKVSPGIWPESSGGQTGANIEVAGFPSGGDAPFFTNMIEGMPLYGMPSLSFMDSSSLFRIDDTVDRVEIVQGGLGALFGPAQMGASANFILKRGTEQTTGSTGVTYGNEGLWRIDANTGFKVADGWYGTLGGFYRVNEGVRPPQFSADQGGQFTATLNHELDNGSLFIWGRVLDDKNQFIVPVPVIQSASGTSFSAYPGFCPLKCSYGSWNIQNVTLPNPAGGFENANLANGRGGNLYFFGVKYDQHFGDWEVMNNLILDGGGLDTNALFSGPSPRPLGYLLYGCQAPVVYPQGCNAAGAPIDTNNYTLVPQAGATPGTLNYPNSGGPGTGIPRNLFNVQATYAGSGVQVPLDQDVIQQGWWYIQKSLSNFADEFRVSKSLFIPDNILTAGVYFAKYSMNDNWSLGNQMLMTNTPNATAINLQYQAGANCFTPGTANVCHLTNNTGFLNFNNNYNILQHGNARNIAGYLSDSLRIGGWLFDAGARLENIDVHYRGSGAAYNSTKALVPLGTAFDLWNNNVPVSNGLWAYEHYTTTRPTFTGGVNYEFSDHMSAYVRANTGNHFNDFDNGVRGANGNYAPTQTITNYEGGFKFQASWIYADLSVYKRDFSGLQYQETNASGVGTGVISTYGSTAKGVDFVGTVTPFQNFTIRLVADYMDGHYTDYIGCAPYIDIFGHPQCANVNGAPIQRQPKWQARVTPSYTMPWNTGDLTAYITYEYVGQRFEDITGLQPLGTYYMLGAGIIANINRNWQLRIQGTNLTNQIGLTEGNARKTGQATGIGNVLLARPIEGQEINFTVYYKF